MNPNPFDVRAVRLVRPSDHPWMGTTKMVSLRGSRRLPHVVGSLDCWEEYTKIRPDNGEHPGSSLAIWGKDWGIDDHTSDCLAARRTSCFGMSRDSCDSANVPRGNPY